MTTHLVKPGSPLYQDLRLRCGLAPAEASKGDLLGTEDGIAFVDCAGCLRDLIVDMRMEKLGDTPEARWLAGGDTGISSKTIWSVMTGRPVGRHHWWDVPHDPDDFGRCHRLLETFPAWRKRMPEVAAAHPEWSGLVAAWEELTALYVEELPSGLAPRLWDRMRAIEAERVGSR